MEHALRHARVHNQLASDDRYAGGIGWCAFDYNTHANFGSGDRICYHGVTDIFRIPSPPAGSTARSAIPEEEIVLEPAFHWAAGDEALRFTVAMICSNCDHLKLYVKTKNDWDLIAEADPDREQFAHLRYAPFSIDLAKSRHEWGDLRIDGYLKGQQVVSKTYSGRGVDRKFSIRADDTELTADGADATRVVFRVEGPAEIVGDNPFALTGGTGAVWIRAKGQAGTARLTATHPRLGGQTVSFTLREATEERV
jgi:beta-galactosidase